MSKLTPQMQKRLDADAACRQGKVDWDGLFKEWIESGKDKATFLRSKGFDLRRAIVRRNTNGWDKALPQALHNVRELEGDLPKDDQVNRLWSLVNNWRCTQSKDDYRVANKIRIHIESLLNYGFKREQVLDPETGQRRHKIVSNLEPKDLRALAETAATIQRIQRLALGMSTENVGLPDPRDSAPTDPSDKPLCPVFVVEMSERGKFKRARPRKVS